MLLEVTPDVGRKTFPIAPMLNDVGRYGFPAIAVSGIRTAVELSGNIGPFVNRNRKQRTVTQCGVPAGEVAGAGIDSAVAIYAVEIIQIVQNLFTEERPSETEYSAA